jgi:hypothetical protein
LSPEVRNSAPVPRSVRVSLRVAWLLRAWPVPVSLREQQAEYWLVRPEAARQLSPQLQISRVPSVVLQEQQRPMPVN